MCATFVHSMRSFDRLKVVASNNGHVIARNGVKGMALQSNIASLTNAAISRISCKKKTNLKNQKQINTL